MLSSKALRVKKGSSNISRVKSKKVKEGTVLSGVKFNRLFIHQRFVKLTNITENHNRLQYKDGLIVDPIPFDPTGACKRGGIYFVEESEAHKWLSYNGEPIYYMRKVSIPDTAKVYIEDGKFKTDKLILGSKSSINNEMYLQFIEYSLKYIHIYTIFKFIPTQCMNKALCFEIVKRYNDYPYLLTYIPHNVIDKELCLEIIRRYGSHDDVLCYVPLSIIDKELCLEAVNRNWTTLRYVPDHIKDK